MESKRFAKKQHAAKEVPETDSVSLSCTHAYERENKENEAIGDTSGSGNIFRIDRSKRGTAKCMECKKAILKGEVRICKSVPYKSIYIQRFFHVKCAFEVFKRARIAENVVSEIIQLDGVEVLSEEEKHSILQFISDGNEERIKPLPERSVGREKSAKLKAPGKTRTRQVPYQNKGMNFFSLTPINCRQAKRQN